MRLLRYSNTCNLSFTEFFDKANPPYAILSHTWGADAEEVTFDDLTNGTGQDKSGYEKIRFCGEQAANDGLEYFWIDTCCINKANKAELSHAIKSMFRWYRNADRCYVYLPDVSTKTLNPSTKRKRTDTDTDMEGVSSEKYNTPPWDSAFRKSRWFTRGWTLQELLAPRSVEFFSLEREKLGDKASLEQTIHEITGIPKTALQGTPLFHFSVKDRHRWIENRQTKLEEDRAYSLLGIFDVDIALRYGEGRTTAFSRLDEEIKRLSPCLQAMRVTDARDDKRRIEDTKGGLLEDSYRWILKNSDFQRWRDNNQSQLVWVKGDPGKGKTMLLCGIINELSKSISQIDQLSYFFCQATDSRINNATAVLRGLLYLLVIQQPYLVSHIQEKYDYSGKALFEDANAWIALSTIFENILQDPNLKRTYLVIDALDECVTDQSRLLDFITKMSSRSPRVKWIVSSRNEAHIEQRLQLDNSGVRLSLELRENAKQVSHAVDVYINYCLSEMRGIKHNQVLKSSVRQKMRQKANGTFLWVSLVFKELKDAMAPDILDMLEEVPTELKDVYRRMLQQIKYLKRQYPKLCGQVLSTVLATYRPLHLSELHILSGLSAQGHDTSTIVNMCGSFLTIREDNVYFIHQSARDFIFETSLDLVPHGIESVHQSIFSRSLQIMMEKLGRDLYGLEALDSLDALGYPVEQFEPPDPDPLEASRYSCIYWIDHLCGWNASSSAENEINLQDGGTLHEFLKQKFLYWLEALSICRSMSKGVVSMTRLKGLMQARRGASALNELVEDARRFIMYHKMAIENSPLQAYASALMFSPTQSLVRGLFMAEELKRVMIKPAVGERWSSCLQILEGHGRGVTTVVFSHDSTRIASASLDNRIKIWDTSSGECLQTLEGHGRRVSSMAFSHDSTRLVSAFRDTTIDIWDTSSGQCLQTLRVHEENFDPVYMIAVISPSITRLALGSIIDYGPIKILDLSSGKCHQILQGCSPIAFSHDSSRLASGSHDMSVSIWDVSSGRCLQVLKDHAVKFGAVAFSHDSTRLASGSDFRIMIWDTSSGQLLQTLGSYVDAIQSVAFSHDSAQLVSGSGDGTVQLWGVHNSDKLLVPQDYEINVESMAISHESARLALAANHVHIWDAMKDECLQTLYEYGNDVTLVAFSHDLSRLASGSSDYTVQVWDIESSECLLTLKGHSSMINSMAFSYNSVLLASSDEDIIKIWDAKSGDCLQTFEDHETEYGNYCTTSFAFSTDLSQVAFPLFSENELQDIIELRNISNGECIRILEGHSSGVTSVTFSSDSARLASSSIDGTIKLWDLSSGRCLQTFRVGKELRSISFGANDSCLHTDIGSIKLNALSSLRLLLTESKPEDPQYQGLSLSADERWISYNSKNLVWIPPEYRSCRNLVSLGTQTLASENSVFVAAGPRGLWMLRVQM